MVRFYLSSVWLLMSVLGFSQDQYLVINPDGHKGNVLDADIDAKGNIITGSFDKTIKVWSSKKGRLINEFRGEIGPGNEGMIYTLDISPNQKYIAVAGWFGKNDESEKLGDVRIYDYETGKIYRVLSSFHANVVRCVRFTPDSQNIIIADADGFIIKWNVRSKQALMVYETNLSDIINIEMGDDYFTSAHYDGYAYKWDLNKEKPVKKLSFFSQKKLKYPVSTRTAISKDGNWIAVAGKELGMVLILNRKMKLVSSFTIDNCQKIIDMDFSPSGDQIICSVQASANNRAVVFSKHDNQWVEMESHPADAMIHVVKFLTEETCVTIGGFSNQVDIWDLTGKKEDVVMKGIGQTYYSASLNGSILSYGLVADKAYGRATCNESFNLFTRRKQPIDTTLDFNYPVFEQNGWFLYNQTVNRQTQYDPNEILQILHGDTIKAEIKRYYWNGYVNRTFSFIDDKYLVSGGDYGMLKAYDYEGNEVSNFVGHEGAVSSVSLSENGEFLVTASYDNTIRIWPLNKVGVEDETVREMSMFEIFEALGLGVDWQLKIKEMGLEKEAKSKSVESGQKVIDALRKSGEEVSFLQYYLNGITANQIKPVVSIFVASNDEWVIWNPEGYFTSSKKGAQFIGYHINQGKKNEAKYYPFEQFDLKYNRPDIIFKDLQIADASIIDLYHRAYLKRLKRANISEKDLLDDIHVPTLKIEKYEQTKNDLTLSITAKDSKYKLKQLNVFINDVPVFGRKGKSLEALNTNTVEQKIALELMEGENKVQVSVLNDKGTESFKETLYLTTEMNQDKDLYVVAIGVSEYQNEKFNLKYAAKDAEDVINAFDDNKLYSTVHNLLLTNEKVTKSNIYQVQDFLKNVKPNDVVILFVAGHGVLDKDYNYYYCTHDIDFNHPEEKGMSYIELEALFDKVKAIRKLLIMDTCHSGEVDKEEVEAIKSDNSVSGDIIFRSTSTQVLRQRKGLKQTNETVKEMFNDLNRGTGTTVLSSAGGVEFAMESDQWKNGLFTYCLLNGLKSKKADFNQDGMVYLSELQLFIRSEVMLKSKGKQTPTSRFENISLDYPIW
ncbi:MAG: caspase family protein [Putridiphycobacter sp.]